MEAYIVAKSEKSMASIFQPSVFCIIQIDCHFFSFFRLKKILMIFTLQGQTREFSLFTGLIMSLRREGIL